MKKTAVILFNLGGPDAPEAVRPFLFNLFNDKAIIRVPQPLRGFIAMLISWKRAPFAREIYAQIGNRSPLREWTEKQAQALEQLLNQNGRYKVFIAMRYWHPFAEETAQEVKRYTPDEIILLPLYPQYSTTTTASSLQNWKKIAKRNRLDAPAHSIECYPVDPHFIQAHVELLKKTLATLPEKTPYRILFSAHGLPEKIIAAGDPYQNQVEQTVEAIMQTIQLSGEIDYSVCYQSRVGPLQWIGPSTEEELKRAGADGKAVVLVPVAFVSEHSETLVELDIEYKKLAQEQGIRHYLRVPALGTHPAFIRCLAELCGLQSYHPTSLRITNE